MTILKKEDKDLCRCLVSFSFEKEIVHKVIDSIAQEACKTARFPGFRPGKATPDVAKVFAKKQILEYAKQQLTQDAYDEILYETKWKQSFPPQVERINITMDSFDADILVSYLPEFELKQYKDFKLIEPKDVQSKEFVVDKIIEELCFENASVQPFTENDFVLANDDIIIDFKIKDTNINNPFILKDSETGVMLSVGRTQVVPGFDEEIIGMKVGENRTFNLNVSPDWSRQEIAGKNIQFDVTLVAASRKIPAVFDEELAKVLKKGSLEELQEAVNKQADELVNNTRFAYLKNQIIDKLIESNDIKIPEWLVIENAKKICEMQGIKWALLEQLEQKAGILNASESNLKLIFVIDKIKALEVDANLTTEETYNVLNHNLPYLNKDVQLALAGGKDPMLLTKALSDIQTEWVLKWVADHCEVISESTTNNSNAVAE